MTLEHLELTPDEEQQAVFVREVLFTGRDFHPFAVFDEPLDCIRVVWRDCSVTETRINDLLTVHEANYPTVAGTSEIVGFSIKGVAYICEENKISSSTPWKLADFLDAVVRASAPRERVIVNHIVKPMVQERNLDEVERIAA